MARSRDRYAAIEDELQFIVFRVGAFHLALDIFQVVRILRYQPPSRLPGAPGFVAGALAFEGRALPVLDLRQRLGQPAESQEETRYMVLQLESRQVALVVDEVHEALRVDSRAIAIPAPPVAGLDPEGLSGAIRRSGRTILVLNPARLLSGGERGALAEVTA